MPIKDDFLTLARAVAVFFPLSITVQVGAGTDAAIALAFFLVSATIVGVGIPGLFNRNSIHPFHWIETGQFKGQLDIDPSLEGDIGEPEKDKGKERREVKGVGPARAQYGAQEKKVYPLERELEGYP